MLRKLLAWLLRAELAPAVNWSETDSLEVLARIEASVPQLWSGNDTVQQVLGASRDGYVFFRRWTRSGALERVSFRGPLDGRQMRLTAMQAGPNQIYRLQLWPNDGQCVYACARRTWFGLWRNQPPMEMGAMIGHVESGHREELKDLRHRLLGGQIPESVQNEEAMWERINSLPEAERRGAMAALAMQSIAAMDRQFHQEYPDAGPIPADLQPAFDAMQKRVQEIGRTAAAAPPDAELADQMQQFVADARRQGRRPPESNSSE
jgi:hypothetical protein